MQTASALLRLTRPASTILACLSVLLPVAARTGSMPYSVTVAVPMLFIAMCTFILNDIDDIETDKVNHPERPLPSGRLLLRFVTATYFACLALALFLTKAFVPGRASYLYYTLLILSINYKYAAEHFPNLKAIYVAGASIFPILVTVSLVQSFHLYLIGASTFFFILGRELLLDYIDRAGDPASFVSSLSKRSLTLLAFGMQASGLALLLPFALDVLDILAVCLIAALSLWSFLVWVKDSESERATGIMKVQMYGGLYFLLQ